MHHDDESLVAARELAQLLKSLFEAEAANSTGAMEIEMEAEVEMEVA